MAKLVEIKTKQTEASVDAFIQALPDEQKRKDAQAVLKMMQKATGEKPKLWGPAIIGFGDKIYKSPATGREVKWFIMGFSLRKANLSLHLVIDVKRKEELLNKLGKHKTGVGCLYINKLADVDTKVLEKLIAAAADTSKTGPEDIAKH
ncbi:MAG: DUF1801 domain-containing protein [Sphingobacteriales bacterium]|jgi:hypothetical protein